MTNEKVTLPIKRLSSCICNFFSSFPTNTSFLLFEVNFSFKLFSLPLKAVFLTKSSISPSVDKSACFHLAAKFVNINF